MEPQENQNNESIQPAKRSFEVSRTLQVVALWLDRFAQNYRREFTQGESAVYAKYLCDLDADILDVACERCITENKFLPNIAEIRTIYYQELETIRAKDYSKLRVKASLRRGA